MTCPQVRLVTSGARDYEAFDVRMLTSGVYIHGLTAWGKAWPRAQLLVLQSEALFADNAREMARVQAFLGLHRPFASERHGSAGVHNRNADPRRVHPLARTNRTLDAFFAPFNSQLYEWCARHGVPFAQWPNASADVDSAEARDGRRLETRSLTSATSGAAARRGAARRRRLRASGVHRAPAAGRYL